MVTLLLTEQLTVLFLMMGCGFVLVKTKIVKSRDSKNPVPYQCLSDYALRYYKCIPD